MTLNFLMYRRNERKKEGEENRGTHPRVSLFHSHRPTLLYPFLSSLYLCFSRPNVCLFFFLSFFFSFFTLPSYKESSRWRFVASILLYTNLVNDWHTEFIFVENRRRCVQLSLSSFPFSLSLFFSFFLCMCVYVFFFF